MAFVAGQRSTVDRHYLAFFGMTLCAGWLLVAVSSYQWIKTWRTHMSSLGQQIKDTSGVAPSSLLFDHTHRHNAVAPTRVFSRCLEWFSWHIRSTLITCCLPALFLAGWIYLSCQQLLCIINGWPVRPSMAAAGRWLTMALRAHPEPGARAAQLAGMHDAGKDAWGPTGVLHACEEVLDAVGGLVSAVEPGQFTRPRGVHESVWPAAAERVEDRSPVGR
ncbi:hypothetical protein ACFS5L_18820 [Streptomyces phyllanthi]|uniref:Uncharacterized protein n=1 Tax=Streptomyces phyllanthi TaxID=1803180 RepID=A0A5N8WAP7_9ACTN|nr:hypothetical protein [Streptomyces phyllanthi]MPY43498.1 hypothetical protein [Streptomyces phyllanthi]